jgi:hypothetical protein
MILFCKVSAKVGFRSGAADQVQNNTEFRGVWWLFGKVSRRKVSAICFKWCIYMLCSCRVIKFYSFRPTIKAIMQKITYIEVSMLLVAII